ncbi:hypothetical protein R3W88_011846 [Solanum pinnatisectum]|uniref:Uncharacterized protein n=1 Tax=Solanum pinnatisectum TaxID=50273 RepID=A0AAV9L803_9SOLN|nr:hypothetical protein R3W88_011846 [Solanum pinnatisectum]
MRCVGWCVVGYLGGSVLSSWWSELFGSCLSKEKVMGLVGDGVSPSKGIWVKYDLSAYVKYPPKKFGSDRIYDSDIQF